jgi:hypothetical protein
VACYDDCTGRNCNGWGQVDRKAGFRQVFKKITARGCGQRMGVATEGKGHSEGGSLCGSTLMFAPNVAYA